MFNSRTFLFSLVISLVVNTVLWVFAMNRLNSSSFTPTETTTEILELKLVDVKPAPKVTQSEAPPTMKRASATKNKPSEATLPEPLNLGHKSQYIEVPKEVKADLDPIEDTDFIGIKSLRAKDKFTDTKLITSKPRMTQGTAPSHELQEVPLAAPLLPSTDPALLKPDTSSLLEELLPPAEQQYEKATTEATRIPEPPPIKPSPEVVDKELVALPARSPEMRLPRILQDKKDTESSVTSITPAQDKPPHPQTVKRRSRNGMQRLPMSFKGAILMDRLPAPLHRDTRSNAILYGDESFNVKPDQYAAYYKHLRDSVGRYWFTLMASFYAQRGYLVERVQSIAIRFDVDRSGNITNIRTLVEGKDPLFESICLRALRSASPLRPLPKYVTEPKLKIVFNFVRPIR